MIDEPTTPYPPRYRWMKRLTVVYVVLIGATVGGWFAWDAVAARMMDAEVARLHGKGQKVFAAEFVSTHTIPDEENAAILYLQAGKGITFSAVQNEFESYISWDQPLTDARRVVLDSFAVDFAGNLKLVRAARQRTKSNWNRQYGSPLLNGWVGLRATNPYELSSVVHFAAISHHLHGDDAEAVECVRDLMHLARATDADSQLLFEHYTAHNNVIQACLAIDHLAPEMGIDAPAPPLRLASTRPSTRPARPASRAQVETLIRDLLNDSLAVDSFRRGLQGEQATAMDTTRWLCDTPQQALWRITGGTPPGYTVAISQLLKPTFQLSAVRVSQRIEQRNALARQPNGSVLVTTPLKAMDYRGTGLRQTTRLTDGMLEGSSIRVFTLHASQLATRRAAAIKLAVRLYMIDNGGNPPDSLEVLVPAYLPVVPADPFAIGTRPMGYVKWMRVDGQMTPIVYSVGEDQVDQQGSTKTLFGANPNVSAWSSNYRREDMVFPLYPPPAKTPQVNE